MAIVTSYSPWHSSSYPPNDWISDEILENIDENLENDPEFQAWVNEGDLCGGAGNDLIHGNDDRGAWVPLGIADRSRADRLAALHPNQSHGEEIRQKTLAAAALTRYLQSHGIELGESATNHSHDLLQLLNPNADVVLPNLGKLEAVLAPKDLNQVEINLNPGTLAYVLVELEAGEAWLRGILFSHDLRQDWPEGGMIPVVMAKPIEALWEAHAWWQKERAVIAQCSEQQSWSPELQAQVITLLRWGYDYVKPHDRPIQLSKLIPATLEGQPDLMALAPLGVREIKSETDPVLSPRAEESVNWLSIIQGWLEALEEWAENS